MTDIDRSKTVLLFHKVLDDLANHNTVHFKWIAAHVGHVGHWTTRKQTNLHKWVQLAQVLLKG